MTQENAPQTEATSATSPEASTASSPGGTVQRRLILAWLALAWERIWVRLWVVGVAFLVFGIVLLTDVLPTLHWVVHIIVVLAVAGGIGYLVWKRLHGFTWPTRDEARARLETTSPVEHRPLTTVEDTLVAGATAIQQWMWRLHQARAHDDLDRLRVKAPAPGVATRDRFALRAAVVLALFVAVVGGWGDIGNRVWRGIAPMLGGDTSNIGVKVWITPPAYTNLSPTYIETPLPEGTKPLETLDIPQGSKLLTVVTGTARDTYLKMGDTDKPLEKLADETQRVETDLKALSRLEVRQSGRMLAGWDVKWIKDAAPTVTMPTTPEEAGRWRLSLEYLARDDYGINTITAKVTKKDDDRVLEFPVNVPPGAPTTFSHKSTYDLASDMWAGEDVVIHLVVTDHGGNGSESDTMEAKLPLRVFVHPVSKELVSWRKGIYDDADQTIPKALESVTRILQHPEEFGREPIVYLTLATAKYRMTHEEPNATADSVIDLLWHAAVRIEDGNLVNAEQHLADAEKALRDALARGAPAEEINRLLKELKQAVAEYSKAMAAKNPGDKNKMKEAKDAEDAVNQAMEKVKETKEMGAEEAAKKALDALQEKLQAMRDGNGAENELSKQAQKLMEQMNSLAEAQSETADESQKQAHGDDDGDAEAMSGGTESGDGKEGAKEAAAKQQELRDKLDDLINQMQDMTGKTPEGMSDADQSMENAVNALNRGAWKDAADEQAKATGDLQTGLVQVKEEFLKAMLEKGKGQQVDPNQAATEERYAPLEPREGVRGGDKVSLPTEPDTKGMAQRVRVILDEIRKRAEDRTRPEQEQEYLKRLRKQF